MAKFSGKNIEFKSGQKAIFGDNDDSSIYWDENGVQLAITTVASGVGPVEDYHLATKMYVDEVFDPTISGGIGNVLFGSEFVFDIDEQESSTNSTTYVNKATVNTGDVPEGSYRVGWHFDWRCSKSNASFDFQIQLDDTATIAVESLSPQVDVTIWNPRTNFYYIETLSSGTHHIDLDFKSSAANATAYIKAARLEFWRVS